MLSTMSFVSFVSFPKIDVKNATPIELIGYLTIAASLPFLILLSGLTAYVSGKSLRKNWMKGKKRQQSTIRKIHTALTFKKT